MTRLASSARDFATTARFAAVVTFGIGLAILASCSKAPQEPTSAAAPSAISPQPAVAVPHTEAPAVVPTAATVPAADPAGIEAPFTPAVATIPSVTTTAAVATLPRANLFAPPEMDTGHVTHLPPESSESENPISLDVSLKGFARIGDEQAEPRVVLMIGDCILPLSAGQERDGVRVISIAPPQVTLERAGAQWNLSMEARKPATENDATQPR